MMYRKSVVLAVGFVVGIVTVTGSKSSSAQVIPSSTPARVIIPSAAPLVTELPNVTPTPTYTPTPVGTVLLEAKNEANVRASPSLESDKLGTIRAGETFPVLGRYFRWYQFRYDPSPSGTGWVYDELVDIVGDVTTIPDLNANILPTVDTSLLSITQTWAAITQTPGGLLTATAEARFIQAPLSGNVEVTQDVMSPSDPGVLVVLPTFTYPPNIVAQAPNDVQNADATETEVATALSDVVSNGIAPIVPIMALVGFGVLGLIISSMRK